MKSRKIGIGVIYLILLAFLIGGTIATGQWNLFMVIDVLAQNNLIWIASLVLFIIIGFSAAVGGWLFLKGKSKEDDEQNFQ